MREKIATAIALICLILLVIGCVGRSDDELARLVEAVSTDDGELARKAQDALVAHGRDAIALLETGLYTRNPRVRRRVVETLQRIGHRDALPILEHVAANDEDAEVREIAAGAVTALAGN